MSSNIEERNHKKLLPSRSRRFGVGKEIGGAVYIHRDYEYLLGEAVSAAKEYVPSDFVYTIVKYRPQTNITSFIQCLDFDESSEPTVGDSFVVYPSGDTKRFVAPTDPFLYHHKWLFVADDYTGFSVVTSIQRSLSWLSIPDIDMRRIGRSSYWFREVNQRISMSE